VASLPEPIANLISVLGKLPGIGPRSAERIALHLVQADVMTVERFAAAVVQARKQVTFCKTCGALTVSQPCDVCSDPNRDASLVCVVERPVDILSIDKSGGFRGRYHVLGGKISPINGVGPEDLNISALEKRFDSEKIEEIIIALPSDVEGDATSYYLGKIFSPRGVKVSRLAQGLAVGSGLEYADDLTLTRAIEGRRQLD
jgi:recombination protein RecR